MQLIGTPMPTGPKGPKRPAGVIGNAIKVMRVATREEEDNTDSFYPPAARGQNRIVRTIAQTIPQLIQVMLG